MILKNYNQLPQYIMKFFQNPSISNEIKHNLGLFRLKDTPDKVRARVARMLRPTYQYSNRMVAYSKKSRYELNKLLIFID